MGVVTPQAMPTYPYGFPDEVIDPFMNRTGRGVLGNKPASGTEIIQELGEEHQRTGKWIVYTSADSVFQIAAHEETVLGHPVDEPETIATAIRIGNPASWKQAEAARDESGGLIHAVTDEQILAAHRLVSSKEGVFVEPGSAASVAGLLASHEAGLVPPARGSSARSRGTASRTRSGRCAGPTGPSSSRCGCPSTR